MTSVLIVDDDERPRAALAALLRSDDLNVVVAETVAAGRAAAAAGRVDVTVVDVHLRDRDAGLSLITELADRLPVIAISIDPLQRRPTLAAGATAFLEKDGDTGTLLDLIRRAANHQGAHR